MSNQLTQEEKVRYAKEARARHKRWVEEHHLTEANYQAWIRENFPKPPKPEPPSRVGIGMGWAFMTIFFYVPLAWAFICYCLANDSREWWGMFTLHLFS